MLLTIGFGVSLFLAFGSARPPSISSEMLPRPTAAAAPAATPFSVEVVTLDYVAGVSTFVDVETYTDYGTSLPSGIVTEYGSGVYDSSLPIETDPCGPKVQDAYTPPTCNSKSNSTSTSGLDDIDAFASYVYQVDTPTAYGVQCLNSTISNAAIKTENCAVTAVDICKKIRSEFSPRGKWVWSAVGGPGCAMAYWLPQFNGSAPAPDKTRCEQGIYNTMVDLCVTEPDGYYGVSDIAAVNLKQLPGANGTGQAVNVGYPSYLIAAAPIS